MFETIKVAVLSSSMLFQRQGGLQIQILETISALTRLGIQADLINPNHDKLSDYDVVHVFGVNHNQRLVEAAKEVPKPVVISPVLPQDWTRYTGLRDHLLDRFVRKLSHWHISTTFRGIDICLKFSDVVVALSEVEKASITAAFGIAKDKVTIIPNGVPARFFEASANLFIQKYGLEPGFILCVATINKNKNQLALAEALRHTDKQVVLIGSCAEPNKEYLARTLEFPNVIYLGTMDYQDPLLASAYAAAGVFCLPSQSEVMPLTALEALATGTPVVMTSHHCMNLTNMSHVLREVEPGDHAQIRSAVEKSLVDAISPKQCKDAVMHLSWDKVALALADIYKYLRNL
jgi:glycosyltransferase involved in cell wall biosynthesis